HELLDHLGCAEAERLGDLLDGGAGLDLGGRLLRALGRLARGRLGFEVGLDPARAAPAATAAACGLLRRWRRPVAPRRLRVDDHAATASTSASGRLFAGSA